MRVRLLLVLATALIGAVFVGRPAYGVTSTTAGVIPPQAKPHGMSYGAWSAAWWQWLYALPVHDSTGQLLNPAAFPFEPGPPTPVNCTAGQTGHVWFLAGTFAATPNPDGSFTADAN